MGNLDVVGSVGVAISEFTEFIDGGEDFSGKRFPNAPEVTAAFGGSYFFENVIELHGDASYTGGTFSSVDNSSETFAEGRFLINAWVGYQQENWGAFLYVRNLLDNDYLYQRRGRSERRAFHARRLCDLPILKAQRREAGSCPPKERYEASVQLQTTVLSHRQTFLTDLTFPLD